MKWVLGKRVADSFKFLFNNPIIFLTCIPIAFLGLLSVYVSFETPMKYFLAILYLLFMLFITSFIFTFITFKTAYHEMKKRISFKQNIDLSIKKFKFLFLSEIILAIVLKLFSDFMNVFSLIWTSNFTIALLIVIAIVFLASLVKIILFMPSSVLKGNLGFKESWKIVKLSHAFELILLTAGYALLAQLLSYLPYAGYWINVLILVPISVIILTMMYLDYLKK